MFTGVVELRGKVKSLALMQGKALLKISSPGLARRVKVGGSVSVNGVCLTAVARSKNEVSFQVVGETLKRSNLGLLISGSRVNLELPLRWKARLEGHFVLGHVDGTGQVKAIRPGPRQKSLQIAFPAKLKRYFFEKGSVAIDGISLTLGSVRGNRFWVHLIPHTLKLTTLDELCVGSRVNLEADFLVKSLSLIDNPPPPL